MKKLILLVILALFATELTAQMSYVGRQYDNGNIHYTGSFSGDKETGLWKYYHENGRLSDIGRYSNGEKSGVWKYYYPNGRLRATGMYIEGQKTGEWKYYLDNGKLDRIGFGSEGEDVEERRLNMSDRIVTADIIANSGVDITNVTRKRN